MYVKYSSGFQKLARHHQPLPPKLDLELRPWQQELNSRLLEEPDDRRIFWVRDTAGGKGKSTLMKYWIYNKPEESVLLTGKIADMTHGYGGQRVVFFDLTRTQAENSDHLYSFAESLKNGVLFSPKYDSHQKTFPPPHVVFLANFPMPTGVWSADRGFEMVLE